LFLPKITNGKYQQQPAALASAGTGVVRIRSPHPFKIGASAMGYENSAALLIPSWDGQSLLNQ
jgi:hypothetical protein